MQGDTFHTLILAELDAVYRLACHLSRSHQLAEDLVQETYLRALKSAATFKLGEQGVRPWLFKILHNVIHTRGAETRRERSALEELQQQASGASQASQTPIDCSLPVNWDGVDERIKQSIADLPLTYREVFLLSAVEELKYRDIADVMELPIGTVMSRLARARTMLVERLAALAAERGLSRSKSLSTPNEMPPPL